MLPSVKFYCQCTWVSTVNSDGHFPEALTVKLHRKQHPMYRAQWWTTNLICRTPQVPSANGSQESAGKDLIIRVSGYADRRIIQH